MIVYVHNVIILPCLCLKGTVVGVIALLQVLLKHVIILAQVHTALAADLVNIIQYVSLTFRRDHLRQITIELPPRLRLPSLILDEAHTVILMQYSFEVSGLLDFFVGVHVISGGASRVSC